MTILRSGHLERWEKKFADNDLDKAYLFAGSLEFIDGQVGYYIKDDVTGTVVFSVYDYEDDFETDVREETEKYEKYLMGKYQSYLETIHKIRQEENENLYKEEKKFSRSVSF